MRLAFVIRRDNHYRLLGPAIDRALARGWDVECWHSADEGLKGARTLEQRERGPSFRRGRPRRREFGAGGVGGLAREVSPDVAITMYPPPGLARGGGVRWLGLQYTLNLGELLDGAGVTPFDGLAIHTEHWRTLAADSVRIMKETRGRGAEPVDDGAVAATLRRCATVVGFPELDQLDAELIDPAMEVAACAGVSPPGCRGAAGTRPTWRTAGTTGASCDRCAPSATPTAPRSSSRRGPRTRRRPTCARWPIASCTTSRTIRRRSSR
jgi:hypothetical protein